MKGGALQATRSTITLKGSVDVVVEFFIFCVNSILYQRGIYSEESFKRSEKYGIPLMLAADPALKEYLAEIMKQVGEWLMNHKVQRIVVVIMGKTSMEVLERWNFDIQAQTEVDENTIVPSRDLTEVQREIQALMRNIVASVAFLPLLSEPCWWELLVYTSVDAEVPTKWETSDPKHVVNPQTVKLRSFDTSIHRVDGVVSYKLVPE